MSKTTFKALMQDIEEFIAFQHALGHCSYQQAVGGVLRRFARFAERHAGGRAFALEAALDAWTAHGGKRGARTLARQHAMVRKLCLYRLRRNPRAFVPERLPAPRVGKFLPYLLSHREVQATLEAARRYHSSHCSGETLYLLVLILYCTGLRMGEALRLLLLDVDLKARTFLIRESKGRTRLVPFGEDLAQRINHYLRSRAAWVPTDREPQTLLVDLHGQTLERKRVWRLICRLWRQLRLKPAQGRRGPRPYDLRHAYARDRLAVWYRKGADLHAQLPWLSAYMGHQDLLGTEVYLHATPQLLRTASRRFEKCFKR